MEHVSADQLDLKTFRAIADLAYRESGLILPDEKHSMIQSRLRQRLRVLGLASFDDYCQLITSDGGVDERPQLISALTTNVSHFFREPHHFDLLTAQILPQAMAHLKQGQRFRIWSAGCSNGQEALSTAMTLLEFDSGTSGKDIRILGTDIDPKVIEFAREGVYPERLTAGIPANLVSKYFTAEDTGTEPSLSAKTILRDFVTFNQLNLLGPWPMKGSFDVIFCRNVVIYFDEETQNRLWPRFHKQLSPGGILMLGHSERIATPESYGFKVIGPTTYQKI